MNKTSGLDQVIGKIKEVEEDSRNVEAECADSLRRMFFARSLSIDECKEHISSALEFRCWNGAVILLSHVGDHYSRLASSPTVCHGLLGVSCPVMLARLEKVVYENGKPCWIDSAESSFEYASMNQAAECEQLRASIKDQSGCNAV
ncbi:hypothetical protein IV203_013427 [Nitzschia inconspicua]|uniref:Uncharacterized protein n=1 Tax=Nitzschia inconspicua TaxID=303405 RepID=A0A9K3M5J3_9STRA|nr:hypothetical protein IV203_013427 [Nitzschia inconspicua]